MIKSLTTSPQQFTPSHHLLSLCKKHTGTAEIDYLLLEKQVEQLQELQQKTCHKIVQFVDEHREEMLTLLEQFGSMEELLESSSVLLRALNTKIDEYKVVYFEEENKLRKEISEYEEEMLEQQLMKASKEEAKFLMQFVQDFDVFINKPIEQLTHKNKSHILRLLRKHTHIKGILEHPSLHHTGQLMLGNLLDNIMEEVEFYLAEQLSRILTLLDVRGRRVSGSISQLDEVYLWYKYLNKEHVFYELVEDTLMNNELPALQAMLVNQRQILLSGKEEGTIHTFFTRLMTLAQQFPIESTHKYAYPIDRLLSIVHRFLSKKELSFLYTYMMPIFPISYACYVRAVAGLKHQEIKQHLLTYHNWNLKIWADVRVKSILDRSAKQKQDLPKWVDIVLKPGWMLEGVRPTMLKLLFLLLNAHCSRLQSSTIEFTVDSANQLVGQVEQVASIVEGKMTEIYSHPQAEMAIKALCRHITDTLKVSTKKWVGENMGMLIRTCKKSLQNYKTFVISTIQPQKQQAEALNTKENIYKSLHNYIKNNPELSQRCCEWMEAIIHSEVRAYYDEVYVGEIYSYCKNNLTVDQMKVVMQRVTNEREKLFGKQEEEMQSK